MIAKIFILLGAFVAAQAVAGPFTGAGHYGGFTAGTAINHVAPVAPLGYAGAYGYGAYGHGAYGPAAYGLGAYGHGLAGAPLAYGHGGVLGARYGGLLGLGHGVGLGKYL